MNVPYLLSLLTSALALIVGIVVHESAHALAAYVLGDRTARSQGKMCIRDRSSSCGSTRSSPSPRLGA